MLLIEEGGGSALNNHGNYIADHGNPWKNHGICVFEFLLEPCSQMNSNVWKGILNYFSRK